MKCAQVYLIGSGPGDPGLLTLRGAACLAASDVVLYDGLSNVAMLSHAPNAQHICVGKHGQSRIWKQEEIIAEMLQHVSHGKTVARLKGGDPAVFARTAEEVDALKAAEIPFEIVPGITAALAAGSYAGIPVTHRKWASAVALVTGHEEPDKPESALDWDALAKFPGTLVIYMGVTTAETWTQALLDAGKPADTPAAILRRVSLPDQQSIHCRLDEVTDHLTPASKFRPPAIVILGAVTKLAETMSWFEHRPLFGTRILVTRPENQSEELAAGLRELGAEVTSQPAIAISAPESWDEVDRCLKQITAGDTLVFASRNGVRFLAKRWTENGLDARHFAGVRIAAVGTRTAEALQEHGLRADIVPDDFTAEGLASTLSPDAQDRRFWLIRASRGRNVLAETLQNAGGNVDQIVTYRNEDTTVADPHIANQLQQGSFDWVTVTSSAIARSLYNLYGDSLLQTKLASISPITTQTLSEIDSLSASPVAAEATTFTMAGLIEAILKHKQES